MSAKINMLQMPNPSRFGWDDGHDKASAAKIALDNEKYAQILDSTGGTEKVAEIHSTQLEHYMRETCVHDKVLPPQDISPSDCEVGPTHDTLYHRIHMQYETRAFLSSFESLPKQVQEVYIPRVFVGFFMLSSPQYVLNDYNIQVYPFPVGKQIQDNVALDMHEAKDWVMLDRLEQAIQASAADYGNILRGVQAQANIDASGNNTGFRGQIEREDMLSLKKYFARTHTRINAIIIPETDYIDLERFNLDDYGDGLMERVFMDGLETDKIHGITIIRTIKIDDTRGDVFRAGNIYGFAPPNQIGRNFTLRGLKFYVDRDHQFLHFDAQMALGFLWAVASRVCKLELYNGGRTTAGGIIGLSSDPPSSDAYFGSPEEVTAKDYFEVEKDYRRPLIRFTGS